MHDPQPLLFEIHSELTQPAGLHLKHPRSFIFPAAFINPHGPAPAPRLPLLPGASALQIDRRLLLPGICSPGDSPRICHQAHLALPCNLQEAQGPGGGGEGELIGRAGQGPVCPKVGERPWRSHQVIGCLQPSRFVLDLILTFNI